MMTGGLGELGLKVLAKGRPVDDDAKDPRRVYTGVACRI